MMFIVIYSGGSSCSSSSRGAGRVNAFLFIHNTLETSLLTHTYQLLKFNGLVLLFVTAVLVRR